MPFEPTLQSLKSHTIPTWYEDAKFGIFIHWGIWAVPAYARTDANLHEVIERDYANAFVNLPYAEWYPNAIKSPDTPSAAYHTQTYANQPYESFQPTFEAAVASWDPNVWADLFSRAGAKYVVLVTKHHDGYCLWPTQTRNPFNARWCSERDVVGELAEAVRARGMRFGVYYSGGLDWTFETAPVKTLGDLAASVPTGSYPAYADAHFRELISRYHPSILWNDIAYAGSTSSLANLFAEYYNSVPEGVANDRWSTQTLLAQLLRWAPVKYLVDWIVKGALDRKKSSSGSRDDGKLGAAPPLYDFRTPEYARFNTPPPFKWESCRGMSSSFGYNRFDTESTYSPPATLLHDFIDAVAKGGNLLLNVGPRGVDAVIPDEQVKRLAVFGSFARTSGRAVFGTRVWKVRQEGRASVNGVEVDVRYTVANGGAGFVFAIVLADLPAAMSPQQPTIVELIGLFADKFGGARKVALVAGDADLDCGFDFNGGNVMVHVPVMPAGGLGEVDFLGAFALALTIGKGDSRL